VVIFGEHDREEVRFAGFQKNRTWQQDEVAWFKDLQAGLDGNGDTDPYQAENEQPFERIVVHGLITPLSRSYEQPGLYYLDTPPVKLLKAKIGPTAFSDNILIFYINIRLPL
jgi:hypothetical protein